MPTPEDVPMMVSVVTPAYNAAATIAETLESLQAQTYPHWEVVVVDDGSTDHSAKVAADFVARDSRIRLTRRSNGGESAARNTGIALARYDWLMFLDADDWIAPTYLERMTGALAADRDLDAVHCLSVRVASDGTMMPDDHLPPTGDLFPTLAREIAFHIHDCVVRRSLVEAVGGFDTSIRGCPDWDLWQRIARTGARWGAVREVLTYYRMSPNSASLNAQRMLTDGLRILKQGHAPDPRVPHPHPDHANGRPPEEVETQQFYVLAWCAGLLLGRQQDARPLLDALTDTADVEIDPKAVAECIFDAAPLPSCRTTHSWDVLWPGVEPHLNAFLVALEARSGSHGLPRRVIHHLREMIVRSALGGENAAADDERAAERHKELVEELERIEAASLLERMWSLRVAEGNVAELALSSSKPGTVRILIERADTENLFDIQLNRQHLKVSANRRYAVQFRARADQPRGVSLGFARAHEPWNNLGLFKQLSLTTEWQCFREEFAATDDDDVGRIHFDLGGCDVSVDVSDVGLHEVSEETGRID